MDSISNCHVTLSLTPVFSSKILIPPKEMVKKIFCLCSPLERAPATTPCWKEEHGFYFSVFIWKFPLVKRHVRQHQLEPRIMHVLPLSSCGSLRHILTSALRFRIIVVFAVLPWDKHTPDLPVQAMPSLCCNTWLRVGYTTWDGNNKILILISVLVFYIECGFNLLNKGKSCTISSNKDDGSIFLEIFFVGMYVHMNEF